MTLTSLLVELVEDVEELWMHIIDGLEEGEHGAVVGDAAPTHVIALHAVQEGGDGVLQSFQELLVVFLRLPVLILLLKEMTINFICLELGLETFEELVPPFCRRWFGALKGSDMCFNKPPLCSLAAQGRDFLQAD